MVGMVEQEMPAGVAAAPPAPGQTMEQVPPVDPAMEEMEDDGIEADESDPSYQAAMQFVADALYRNDAAQSIATQIEKASDKVKAVADISYDIANVAIEKLEGQLPEELYILFASTVLEEISEISEAAGVELTPGDIAGAMKQMILRFLGEMGENTSELQVAMDQFTPEMFDKMAQEAE